MTDDYIKTLVEDLCILYRGVVHLEDTEGNDQIEHARQRIEGRATRFLVNRVQAKQKADIEYKISMLQDELKSYD